MLLSVCVLITVHSNVCTCMHATDMYIPVCVCVCACACVHVCVCVCVCVCVYRSLRKPEGALEVQVAVSCSVWVLGTTES